jgi:hypothetical protein
VWAGGIVGNNRGTVKNCAALNSTVKGNNDVGRVVGVNGTSSDNIAFAGMTTGGGAAFSGENTHDGRDGEDISIEAIHADGTLGGRFTQANGWTTENGKLPGLFGKTVNMPEHLGGQAQGHFSGGNGSEAAPYIITTAAQLAKLAELVNEENEDYNAAYYRLGNDIDLSDYGAGWNDGHGWIPIGNGWEFFGVFDGNNKKLRDCISIRNMEKQACLDLLQARKLKTLV